MSVYNDTFYANSLFSTLRNLKTHNSDSQSAQHRLLEYCKNTLGAIERLHVDFKEKQNRQHAGLDDSDKKNLAKAVSGFANSSGGVLIWGIADDDLAPRPVADVRKFTLALAELAVRVTEPVVQGLDVDWLPSDETQGNSGFALLYVPESDLPPHRVVLKNSEVKDRYYIRSAESFVPATHIQLEDMFGRRPKPRLALSVKLEIESMSSGSPDTTYSISVLVGIENEGRGSARAPFLALHTHKPYELSGYGVDGNGNFGLKPLTRSSRSREHQFGAMSDIVIHSGMVLDVASVRLKNYSVTQKDKPPLVIDWRIGAEGIAMATGQTIVSSVDFDRAIHEGPQREVEV